MAKRSGLDALSITELHRELRKRERAVGKMAQKLEKKRDHLASQLAEIESQLAQLGASSRRAGGRRRARNDESLADALSSVLKNATMSVTEVMEAVQRSGYVTTSPNFRTIVNQTLLNQERFKRVGRGRYTAK